MPIMKDLMTTGLITIEEDADFRDAEQIMKDKRIRHLPVMRQGVLVGILSDRDVRLAQGFAPSIDEIIHVKDICTPSPLTVGPTATLAEIGNIMLNKKIGCVLITERGKLEGIFTEFDAIRTMMLLLRAQI